MHNLIEKNKSIVVTLILVAVVIYGYNLFFAGQGTGVTQQSPVSGEELLSLSEALSAVSFNESVLSSPGYRLLIDWSIEPLPENVGRINPFGNLGQ